MYRAEWKSFGYIYVLYASPVLQLLWAKGNTLYICSQKFIINLTNILTA